MGLLPIILVCFFIQSINGEEAPPAHYLLAQRLMSTLPELPQVIQGGMNGENAGLKNMISNVLGDGLISQLVVNPMGVADDVLPDLGLNKTEVMANLDKMSNGMASNMKSNSSSKSSSKLFGGGLFGLLSGTTTPRTTTEAQMLVDGQPVDFDNFVREHNLENSFSTRKPPPTTPVPPSSEKIAEEVFNKLKSQMKADTPMAPQYTPTHPDDFASTLNMAMVDPRRRQEINQLLRRAPQRFDTMDIFGNPPGFVQENTPAPLDPAIDEVVTNLRMKGPTGISVEDVERLKNILRTYEESLQTKEFIAKRNQMHVLQRELEDHRKRIDLQKRMEDELVNKARELEQARQKMELQLMEQLQQWNLTQHKAALLGGESNEPIRLSELQAKEKETTTTTTTTEEPRTEPPRQFEEPIERPAPQPEVRRRMPSSFMAPSPSFRIRPATTESSMNMLRYAPRASVPISKPIRNDEAEFSTSCNCQEINMNMMKGKWAVALASKQLLEKMYSTLSNLLQVDVTSDLTCSSIEVSPGKQSIAAQESKIMWEFRRKGSRKLHRLSGNTLSFDSKTMRFQMKDFKGGLMNRPVCVLNAGGEDMYDYMLVTSADGPCDEAALVVRNPDEFFDRSNTQLVKYLKREIGAKRLQPLDMVSFANECEDD